MLSVHLMPGLLKQQPGSLHCVLVSQATFIPRGMCLAGSSASLFLIKTESVLEKPCFLFLGVFPERRVSLPVRLVHV